ncbi:chymotrypsin B-like [Condylostylus longicornis]|uniref:chymotrypsin B-like n=1 Tax=Condylostylus longicornis TaxID=2530218 RepID=UPI00244E3DA5|nr:chymotrypsin B-like [Condylostylus longicornis]
MKYFKILFTTIFILIYLLPVCLPFERNLNSVYEAFNNDEPPKCEVPDVDGKKIEVLCFNVKELISGPLIHHLDDGYSLTNTKNFQLHEEQCIRKAAVIIIRCKIGYENIKYESDNYMNICINGEWEYEKNDNNDCKLICGEKTKMEIEKPVTKPLIYHGKMAKYGSSPWHVAIYKNVSNNIEQICGGSIIHSNIVISAGHCFRDIKNIIKNNGFSKYIIGAGKHIRDYSDYEETEQFRDIEEVRVPPTYQENPLRSDIAIIILKTHFKFTSYISPVCMDWDVYKPEPIKKGYLTHLFGWGATSAKKSEVSSRKLLTAELETITNEECKQKIDRNSKSEITDERLCAVNLSNSTACEGDSGGGLILERHHFSLIGIVSVGLNLKNYCSDGFITVFTNVQYFHDFIKRIITETRNKEYNIIGLN